MNIENNIYFIRDSKRQSYSSTRSKPLECIYHNPILKSLKQHKKIPPINPHNKEISVKVVDLKLPTIVVPRLINRFLQNYNKAIHTKKPHGRCISLIPELLITSSKSALNYL